MMFSNSACVKGCGQLKKTAGHFARSRNINITSRQYRYTSSGLFGSRATAAISERKNKMIAALVARGELIESRDRARRDIFTLSQYYVQTPYVLGRSIHSFLRAAFDVGLFAFRQSRETWVCNLDPRKMDDQTEPHLVIDLDGLGAPGDGPLPTFEEMAAELVQCVREHVDNEEELDFAVAFTGCQPEDKAEAGTWSVHAHFPYITYRARPPKAFIAAINALPTVVALRLHADRSIYTNGIRFGTCSKPLRDDGWRQAFMQLLLPDTEWWMTFPLHVKGSLVEAVFADDAAAPPALPAAPVPVAQPQQPLIDACLTVYRRFIDRNANVQATGVVALDNGATRVHFADSDACVCVHVGNNHYGVVNAERTQMSVYCGGGQELVMTLVLPPIIEPEAEAADDYVTALAAWLEEQPYTTVATAFTTAEYETLGVIPPPHPVARPVDRERPLCIDVETFNALRDAGASHGTLAKYLNLAVTLTGSTKTWMVRGSDNFISTASYPYVTQVTANFRVPNDKDKMTAFLAIAQTLPEWTTMASFSYYRPLDPAPGRRALTLRGVNPLPVLDEQLQLEVSLWWGLFLRVLTYNSASATSDEDIRPALSDWIGRWTVELLFGYQPLGLGLVLVEPAGGVGKSLFAAIISNLLGKHQSQPITNMQRFLDKQFNYDIMTKRFFIYDDGVTGGEQLTHVKNFITQHSTSCDVKYGTNGVVQEFTGVLLMITNKLDAHLSRGIVTEQERRLLFANPGRAYPELLARLTGVERDTAMRLFGETHASFLAFGYKHFADGATPHARALCRLMLTTYRQLCEAAGDRTLKHALRADVESQRLLTKERDETARKALGSLGGWIETCLEEASFFSGAAPPQGTVIATYAGPHVAHFRDDLPAMPQYVHLPSLRKMYVASIGNNRAVDHTETASDPAFKAAFLHAFNTLMGGPFMENNAHRVTALEYRYNLGWNLVDPDTKQLRGFYKLRFPGEAADEEEEAPARKRKRPTKEKIAE